MDELTLEQRACNFETLKHIRQVAKNLNVFIKELLIRGEYHDLSKLEHPEVQLFTELTPRLSSCEYGSGDYKGFIEELGPALEHHYRNNRHHPEFWQNGIESMNLVDILEMFCDWAASTQRTKEGSLHKSLPINAERFKMSPQLVKIFRNTISLLEKRC
jgi:hypothetical protein